MPTPSPQLEIPRLGAAEIIPAVNDIDCVDPRVATPVVSGIDGIMSEWPVDPGAIRFAGATAGTVMALHAAAPEVSIATATGIVCGFENVQGRTPTFHTDNSGKEIGCGHVAKAAMEQYAALYDLDPAEAAQILERMSYLGRLGLPIKRPVLQGPHQEVGVLVVDSSTHTVNPVTEAGPFFRYDRGRHQRLIRDLAIYVSSTARSDNPIAVNPRDLQAAADRQLNATLGLIAADLPVYNVILRGDNRSVEFAGNVPAISR